MTRMTILWGLAFLGCMIVREFAYFMWRREAKRLLKERRDFIERLARTELVREFRDESLTAMWICPRCAGDAQDYFCRERFVHMPSCPVVEARQLLGLLTDERGNLVVER